MAQSHPSQSPPVQSPLYNHTQGISHLIANGALWCGESAPSYTFTGQHKASEALPFGIPEIDQSLPHRGLQRGAIHEMFYNDSLQPLLVPSCIPTCLASNAHKALMATNSLWNDTRSLARIIWIGKRCWPTPHSMMPEHSSPSMLLNDSLFIDPPNDKLTLWALETALRSPAVDLVIAACPRVSLVTTKRLSLAAHTSGATAILLRHKDDAAIPSCAMTKWFVTPSISSHDAPAWELTLAKIKGNAVDKSSWLIGLYEENSNVSLRALPRVVDSGHEEEAPRKGYGT